MENEEVKDLAVKEENSVTDFSQVSGNSKVEVETLSNIKDSKEMFNLSNHADTRINECIGEKIRMKKVLINKYYKPLKEPVVDEETGEIIKDTEMSVSCVIVDDNGKSYATGSKTFTFDLIKYLSTYGGAKDLDKGIEIKIIQKSIKNSPNKALTFEVI